MSTSMVGLKNRHICKNLTKNGDSGEIAANAEEEEEEGSMLHSTLLLCCPVHNNVLVGPTAEDVASRERAAIDPSITRRLLDWGRQVVPELTSYSPVGQYTGTRPATEFKDYQIHPYPDR